MIGSTHSNKRLEQAASASLRRQLRRSVDMTFVVKSI
jgi:hypothetical protein